MTTSLDGPATRFLPFNRRATTGGAGNPPNPDGHRTAYLWERVWQRDAWLDLLGRFVHVETPGEGLGRRDAQPDGRSSRASTSGTRCCKLEADARERRRRARTTWSSTRPGRASRTRSPGSRTGSRRCTTPTTSKVFDKVVVITDRVVLDRQLQDTIYQFEHAHGVVVRIDEDSQQLADALAGEQARIIITTLQKFPFVLDKIERAAGSAATR